MERLRNASETLLTDSKYIFVVASSHTLPVEVRVDFRWVFSRPHPCVSPTSHLTPGLRDARRDGSWEVPQ